MNLAKIYLIAVFLIIIVLSVSTFLQYQQFQNIIKKSSFELPTQITSNMPNLTPDLGKILNQVQSQQNQAAGEATSTKEYQSPDDSFGFEYPNNWQESNDQSAASDSQIIFSAYAASAVATSPLPVNYLAVKVSSATSTEAIVAQYKKDSQTKGAAVKFSESEIINGKQTIPVIETKYSITEPTTALMIEFSIESAIIAVENKFYVISVSAQGNDPKIIQAADKIFSSIKIKLPNAEEPPAAQK